jgi:hypothetical protein
MSRLTLVAAIAAALVLTVGLGVASAHKRKFERHTTMAFEELPGSTGDRISGVVSLGPKPEEPFAVSAGLAGKCLAGQRVEIKHHLTVEGGGEAGPTTLVATATTDATGAWQTTAYEAAGANQLMFDTFLAEVVKKRLKPKNDRHKHVCIGAFENKTAFSY